MQSLLLSFEAIAPIFLMMLIGYTVKRIKLVDKQGFDTINSIVFKIFLPILLFYNIYKTETSQVFDLNLILFTVLGVLIVFILGYFAVLHITGDNSRRGVMLQSFFRSNYAILGIPLVGYICGEGSGAITSVMVGIVIPLFNILSVISLELFRQKGKQTNILNMLKGVITNPLIIACFIGLLFFLFNIKMPAFLEKTVRDLSSVATPLSIIVLGAYFEFSCTAGYLKEIIISVTTKLILVPLVMLTLGVKLGFSGESLACLLVTFASPVAVSSFAMSKQMDADAALSAQLIVISSAFCLITLFVWIFVFSYMGLF